MSKREALRERRNILRSNIDCLRQRIRDAHFPSRTNREISRLRELARVSTERADKLASRLAADQEELPKLEERLLVEATLLRMVDDILRMQSIPDDEVLEYLRILATTLVIKAEKGEGVERL